MLPRKLRNLPPFLRHIKSAVDPLLRNTARGWLIDSDDVRVNQQPDGRFRPTLSPQMRARVGTAGGGGGAYFNNSIFVIS